MFTDDKPFGVAASVGMSTSVLTTLFGRFAVGSCDEGADESSGFRFGAVAGFGGFSFFPGLGAKFGVGIEKRGFIRAAGIGGRTRERISDGSADDLFGFVDPKLGKYDPLLGFPSPAFDSALAAGRLDLELVADSSEDVEEEPAGFEILM